MNSIGYQVGVKIALEEVGMTKEAFLPALAAIGSAITPWLTSAAVGAGIGGGINAAMAQPGQRMQAFGQGAMYGAMGGIGGKAVGTGVNALRQTAGFKNLMGTNPSFGKKLFNKAFTPGKMEMASQFAMPQPKLPQPAKPNPQPMTNLPWYGT